MTYNLLFLAWLEIRCFVMANLVKNGCVTWRNSCNPDPNSQARHFDRLRDQLMMLILFIFETWEIVP